MCFCCFGLHVQIIGCGESKNLPFQVDKTNSLRSTFAKFIVTTITTQPCPILGVDRCVGVGAKLDDELERVVDDTRRLVDLVVAGHRCVVRL